MSMSYRKLATMFWLVFLAVALLGGCGAKNSIVGRWQFQSVKGSWDYQWMEFFADGSCTDSWGNSRTWNMVSSNRLKLVAGFGAGTYLYDVKITGDKLEITDEYGNRAIGTRVGGATSSGRSVSRDDFPWALLILLAAGAMVIVLLVRRRSRLKTAPAGATSPAAPSPQAFCMHCGQPVQPGSRFCMHCGKPLS